MDSDFNFNRFDDFQEIKFNSKIIKKSTNKPGRKKKFKSENQPKINRSVEIQKNTITEGGLAITTNNSTNCNQLSWFIAFLRMTIPWELTPGGVEFFGRNSRNSLNEIKLLEEHYLPT